MKEELQKEQQREKELERERKLMAKPAYKGMPHSGDTIK